MDETYRGAAEVRRHGSPPFLSPQRGLGETPGGEVTKKFSRDPMKTQVDILARSILTVILAGPCLIVGVSALIGSILQMCDMFNPALEEYFDRIDRSRATTENAANYVLVVAAGGFGYAAYAIIRYIWS
jgi:hypothetical protein